MRKTFILTPVILFLFYNLKAQSDSGLYWQSQCLEYWYNQGAYQKVLMGYNKLNAKYKLEPSFHYLALKASYQLHSEKNNTDYINRMSINGWHYEDILYYLKSDSITLSNKILDELVLNRDSLRRIYYNSINLDVAFRLQELGAIDQACRSYNKGIPDTMVWARQEKIDNNNLQDFYAICEQYGWPTPKLVGRQAYIPFLLLWHHRGSENIDSVLNQFGPYIDKAIQNEEEEPWIYAWFKDFKQSQTDSTSIFGLMSYVNQQGQTQIYPLKYPNKVDSIRASVGLLPLYFKESNSTILPENYSPKNK